MRKGMQDMEPSYRIGQTRRKVLTGMAAVGLGIGVGPGLAADRRVISRGRVMSCDNDGVLISDMADRIVRVADFNHAARCPLTRAASEGPYFICVDTLNSRRIADGLEGTPMTLALRVTDQTCAPVPGAIVDVWQCDARGNYSGFGTGSDRSERFLRGVLATDVDGIAEFDAIYPGYYVGRAIHTHYKVHIGNKAYLTSQALYPEEWNERVLANPVYADRHRRHRDLNANDFMGRRGRLFTVSERGSRLLATINLTV